MALAQLCQMVEWGRGHEYSLKPRFHAFIVDHKAREGSSQEAQLTALRLEQLSISSLYFQSLTHSKRSIQGSEFPSYLYNGLTERIPRNSPTSRRKLVDFATRPLGEHVRNSKYADCS